MKRRASLLLLAALWTSGLAAQWLLEPSEPAAGDYLLYFNPAGGSEELEPAAMMQLRRLQQQRIERLSRDLADTDLQIRRNLWLRQAIAVSLSPRYRSRAEALPYVRALRPERRYRVKPQALVTLPLSGEAAQDNLEQIGVDALWAEGWRGQGMVVAILDSGVDMDHRDLAPGYRGGNNSWFDPYGEQPAPRDLTGHGTAVASIVLGGSDTGSAIGVAPAAQWIAARVFDNSGNSTESAIIEALQWLLDPDGNPATADYPDIVQNAWGLLGTEGDCTNPFETELAALAALGIDLVFAVGNSGSAGPSSYLTPTFDPNVLAVGALNRDGSIWYESSRGPDRCGSSVVPALMAPGEGIKAATLTYNGFDDDNAAIYHGTSFSSPHVSGALALLRSKYRSDDPGRYAEALLETAEDLGMPGIDADHGHGRVRVDAASAALQQELATRLPEVGFSVADISVAESAGTITLELRRSGDLSAPASVTLSLVEASAAAGTDFEAVLPAELQFASGEYRAQFSLGLLDDAESEDDEYLLLELTGNNGANIGSRPRLRLTLLDDDGPAEDEIGGAAIDAAMLVLLGLLGSLRRRRCVA